MIKKQIGRGGGGGGLGSTTRLMAISTNKFFKLISIRFLKWLVVRINKRLKNFAFRRLWEQSFLLILLEEKSCWSLKGGWSKVLSTLQILRQGSKISISLCGVMLIIRSLNALVALKTREQHREALTREVFRLTASTRHCFQRGSWFTTPNLFLYFRLVFRLRKTDAPV